jgi:hypothetical protein
MQFHDITVLLQCFFILQRQDELHSNPQMFIDFMVHFCNKYIVQLRRYHFPSTAGRTSVADAAGSSQGLVPLLESPLLRKVLLAARSSVTWKKP